MQLDGPLVSTQWLADHLEEPALRVYDTTIFLEQKEDGFGYVPVSGRDQWQAAHIPGAGFLDVIVDLSDPNAELAFTMPSPAQVAETMAAHGASDDSIVVLYNKGFPMWSTRVWWMLRSIGFESVAVLNGGWEAWERGGHPVSEAACNYADGRLTVHARPEMWVDKGDMLEMIDKAEPLTINALSPAVYSGKKNQYGRPGHLPGTHNVFYGDLINSETGCGFNRSMQHIG